MDIAGSPRDCTFATGVARECIAGTGTIRVRVYITGIARECIAGTGTIRMLISVTGVAKNYILQVPVWSVFQLQMSLGAVHLL
jgi:hypothetical protein